MTRKIASTAIAAIFGFALTAAAQTPPPSQPPADPQTPPSATAPMPDRAQKADGKKLTGCVQAGTEAGSFELTNVKGKGDAGDKKTVKLAAAPGVDLATHVGHTVELAGSWEAGYGVQPVRDGSGGQPVGRRRQDVQRFQREDGLVHLFVGHELTRPRDAFHTGTRVQPERRLAV